MTAQRRELTSQQQQAIAALLSHASITEAATAVGVNRRTLTRWMADETFRDKLRQAESEVLSSITRQLGRLSEKSIRALEDALDNEDAPAQRLRACEIVLSRHATWRDVTSFDQRLSELENARDETYTTPKRT